MAGAACTDLMQGRVSNLWLLAASLIGFWFRGTDFLMAAAPVLVLGFFLFRFRLMGAGDGKMMAVMVGFLGVEEGLSAIFLGFLIGSFWGLGQIWQDKRFCLRLMDSQRDRHGIPLAACLAVGGYLHLFASGAVKLGGMI